MAHSREERWSLEVCDLLWVFGTYWHTRLRSAASREACGICSLSALFVEAASVPRCQLYFLPCQSLIDNAVQFSFSLLISLSLTWPSMNIWGWLSYSLPLS